MAMALDESRHQELSVAVDHFGGALARNDVAAARHLLDPVVLDDHLAGIFRIVDSVPDGHVAKQIGRHVAFPPAPPPRFRKPALLASTIKRSAARSQSSRARDIGAAARACGAAG